MGQNLLEVHCSGILLSPQKGAKQFGEVYFNSMQHYGGAAEEAEDLDVQGASGPSLPSRCTEPVHTGEVMGSQGPQCTTLSPLKHGSRSSRTDNRMRL